MGMSHTHEHTNLTRSKWNFSLLAHRNAIACLRGPLVHCDAKTRYIAKQQSEMFGQLSVYNMKHNENSISLLTVGAKHRLLKISWNTEVNLNGFCHAFQRCVGDIAFNYGVDRRPRLSCRIWSPDPVSKQKSSPC